MSRHLRSATRFVLILAAALNVVRPALADQSAPAAATREAAAAAPQNAPAVQVSRPPLPNRFNELLPAWLRVRGEFRERIEGFTSLNFVPDRDDAYGLSRLRLNATVTARRNLSFQVQVQDARVAEKEVGPTGAPFKAAFDLRQGFGDFGTTTSKMAVRVGRQELAYGEQRLVGHVSWVNAARTFDGVRATWRSKAWQVDGFAASVVRILDGEFDKSGNGNRFMGAYGTASALVPKSSIEPYVFWRADRNVATELSGPGDLALTTIGVRAAGKLPAAFEYDLETAVQAGSAGQDDISTLAGHYRLRTPVGSRGLRLIGEFNHASGDADPADGKRGTFDHLYPTPHDKYGLADQVGWKNIRHVRAGVDVTPIGGWPINASYHTWWIAEARDGLYNAGGTLIARVPSGAASRHVGQELDIQVSRALTPQLQLLAGYAHIFTGAFLKEATPGASYRLPFVMLTYVFLAEK